MHGVYDERGTLIHETGSEMRAFVLAMERQAGGKLTTVLIGGKAEVLFAPVMSSRFKRAPTALEDRERAPKLVEPQ